MAVHKVKRSTSSAQPAPQHAKTARAGDPRPHHPTPKSQPQPTNGEEPQRNHQSKAELFKTLERLNRGYGYALAALDRLRAKDRLPGKRVFPLECLNDFRDRTEMLRALANRDLLRLLAGHEEWEVERLAK